nr:hypothetical protein [Tanacetum cinerariifolium]
MESLSPQVVSAAKLPIINPNEFDLRKMRIKQYFLRTDYSLWEGNPQHALQDKRVIDSGCSRHVTGNMSYLSNFKELNGGYVAFGGNPKGGKIFGKGKIRTGKLDFDDVYFVNELKFNLFSVSQMCDKKNSVLFTDTECLVLSIEFKLPDENQVLLRVPRENKMYNVDLKNIVPSVDLTCLFAKFCGMKGIKREFSVPRTPQQNRITERQNTILIEAARTMLADSLLPIRGSKFDGKVDEGFLVGYYVSSKDFRVFNCRTRIVQETLHINFLENKPNVAGVQEQFDAEKIRDDTVQQYFLFPVWSYGSKNPQNIDRDAAFEGKKPESEVHVSTSNSAQTKKLDDKTKREDKGKSLVESSTGYRNLSAEFEDFSDNSINEVNAADSPVPAVGQISTNSTNTFNAAGPLNVAVSPTHGKSSNVDTSQFLDDPNIPELEDITYSDDDEEDEELLQFKMQKVWILVDLHNGKRAIGFKDPNYPDKVYKVVKALYGLHQAPRAWYETLANYLLENGFQRGKIDQTLFIKRQKGDILLVQIYVDDIIFGSTNKDLCKGFEKLMKDKFQMSLMGELTLFLGLQMENQLAPTNTENPLLKDPDGEDVDVHTYGLMIGSLMYLISSRPDIMLIVTAVSSKFLLFDASEGFDQIIDFLIASSIKYALTVNPNIYVSCIKQFWSSVSVKKVNDVTRLQALVDTKKVIITKATIRDALRLDDVQSIDCLPNEEIFTELLRTGRRVGKGFYRVYTPLFEGMIVAQQDDDIADEGATSVAVDDVSAAADEPSIPSPSPTIQPLPPSQDLPSTSQVLPTPPSSPIAQPPSPQEQPQPSQPSQDAAISMDLLHTLLETCTTLTRRLERRNKLKVSKIRRLKRVRTAQRVDTSEDTVMDDVSTHGRIIANMDADEDVTLKDVADIAKEVAVDAEIEESADVQGRQAESQAQIYQIDLEHVDKVLSMQDDDIDPTELKEVVKVVTTAKLMTEVVTTASAIITVATSPIPAAIITAAPSAARRRKRVVIKDPEEIATPSIIIHSELKSKDKGKGIMVEEPKPLKKQAQIEQDEAYARELKAELNKIINWDDVIDQVERKEKEDNAMDYFKEMSYDDIRPIFEMNFNSNVAFLEKTREQMKEEDIKALKRTSESQAKKAAKKQKLDEEVPVVDYAIHTENNKPYFKIIRADGTHQLFLSFLRLLRNFNREDLEVLWELVRDRFASSKHKNFSDDFLLTTLTYIFEKPNVEAQVWKSQRGVYGLAKVKSWKLLESSGSLPSNTIANPKGELKTITTRSGIVLDGPSVLIPPPFINPKEDERVEETLTMHKQKQQEKDKDQIHKFWQMFKQLHINITLADALIIIPKYHKMLKALLSNKEKLLKLTNTPLNKNCSAVILKKLPEKLEDPGKFLILCGFSELKCKALADLANRAICTPAGIARDVFVSVRKFTFPANFVIVDYKSDPRDPLILGRPFLRTACALIDVHEEEMILRDGDERLTLNMRHDTSSYSNQHKKESINLINVFNDSSEDFLEKLFSTNHQSGNPTFSSHPELTSPEVKDDIFDPEEGNALIKKLLDLDSTKDLHLPHHVSTTSSSSPNQLLKEFADELAFITFPPRNDDLLFDIESNLKEIEYLLHHDSIKDIDSILKDSIYQSDLDDLNDNLVDTMPKMFIDEHALDYSSPPLYDEYDDDLFEVESGTKYVYDDHFDSKGEKIKESKLLIDELDLPSDFLLPSEYDSFLSEDFSEVYTLPSTNNEDKVFNLCILIQKNLFEVITRVAPEKNEKKLAISHVYFILEDFDLPLYELSVFKEVPRSKTLLSFSFENEEKVFKPEILTSKEAHSSLIPELSHQGYKVSKINQIL